MAGPSFLRGLGTALRLSRSSERGLLRHFAYLAEALCLMPYLRSEEVDHVHVHFGTNAAAVAMLMKRMGGPTYSMTIHGPDEFDAPIGLSLGWKAREALFSVAITHFCEAQIRRWLPATDWSKVHVVGCTVAEEWLAAARPVDEGARDIVCVGRLSEQKGQLVLIDALADAILEADRMPLARLHEMGRAARTRVRAEHGNGEIAKMDALFRRYIPAPGGSGKGLVSHAVAAS